MTKKVKGTLKGSGNIQISENNISSVGYGKENALATENGKLVYKQIYKEGDGIKFTPASDTAAYSKTSIGLNYDDTAFGINDNGALYRKSAYTAEQPISIDNDGKVSLAVDGITMKNMNSKLQMNYKVNQPLTLKSSTGAVGLSVDENTFVSGSTKL